MIPPFRRVRTQNAEVSSLQDATEAVLKQIRNRQIIDGRLIEGVTIETVETVVDHKLGRALRGWIVVRQGADARIWDQQDDNARPELSLVLVASASVKVSLWVF